MAGNGKRTFKELQRNILISLKDKPLAISEISQKAGINWSSTSKQLILLKGTDLVDEIFSHKRLRMFQLTERGIEKLAEYELKNIIFK